MREKASARGRSIECEIEPDTPDGLFGDATHLCRAIGIFVDSAMPHPPLPDGLISLHICEAAPDEDGVLLCISIAVPGPGIGEDLMAVLLGNAQAPPVDAAEAKEFATARKLIGEMGGELWVDNIPSEGFIIQFTVRYLLQVETAPAPASSSPPLHILLVDDVEINQELARIVMEKQGHRVTVAGNGAEALEAYQGGNRFDMIFMDIQMPVMDGFQATHAIRELERHQGGHIPIIAMTAYSSNQDRQECLDAGMDSYIAKPVKPEAIVAEINSHASVHQPESAAGSAPPLVAEVLHADDAVAVFDRDELLGRLCGNSELIPRFISLFITTAESCNEAIRKALAAGDAGEVYSQAHTLKGAAANIGAGRIRAVATTLDEYAKLRDISSAPLLLAELEAELDLFKRDVGSGTD